MTSSTATTVSSPTLPARSVRAGRLRRILRGVAIAACVPYLLLKTAWVFGSHIGIPEGSRLLDADTPLLVGNAAGVLMMRQ